MALSVYVVRPFGPRGKFGVVFCSGSAMHIGVCIYTVLVLIPIQFIPDILHLISIVVTLSRISLYTMDRAIYIYNVLPILSLA